MHIYGPSHLHGAQSLSAPHHARIAQPTERSTAGPIRDELNISDAGRLIEQARSLPDVRQQRVDAIRAQLAAGTYETADKLDIAVERLLDEIG